MDAQEGRVIFREVICSSGGLYEWSGGLYVEENNYVCIGH